MKKPLDIDFETSSGVPLSTGRHTCAVATAMDIREQMDKVLATMSSEEIAELHRNDPSKALDYSDIEMRMLAHGDVHVAQFEPNYQLMAYAYAAGVDTVTVLGGDLLHEPQSHYGQPDALLDDGRLTIDTKSVEKPLAKDIQKRLEDLRASVAMFGDIKEVHSRPKVRDWEQRNRRQKRR